MSFVINTNTLSLTAQQNLNSSQKTLNSAIERLSSGSKINSAKDDAAGQAISNRMTSQINGLKQASSNANDGISLAQTTEGALNQINDNLQRVRELTVQAANGTNSQSDLESIQNEIGQRMEEIDRVSDQTAFNGTKVLDGEKTISIQVGDKDGQTIEIDLKDMDAASLGLGTFNVDGSVEAQGADNASLGGAGTVTKSLVSFEDANGNTAYAIKSEDSSGPSTSYNAATIAADGTVSEDTGTAIAAGDVKNEATIANGETVRTDAAKSANPLATLDSALKKVDDLRSDLGAVQNRLDSAINNISTTEINISSARSRITDADYATEVSNMSKAQILQQAGTSVLAQANQSTQGVLSLLR